MDGSFRLCFRATLLNLGVANRVTLCNIGIVPGAPKVGILVGTSWFVSLGSRRARAGPHIKGSARSLPCFALASRIGFR